MNRENMEFMHAMQGRIWGIPRTLFPDLMSAYVQRQRRDEQLAADLDAECRVARAAQAPVPQAARQPAPAREAEPNGNAIGEFLEDASQSPAAVPPKPARGDGAGNEVADLLESGMITSPSRPPASNTDGNAIATFLES